MAPEEDIFQVSDKDLIGTDERNVGTGEEFEEYIRKTFGKRMRAKEIQTEVGHGMVDTSTQGDMHEMGRMIDQSVDATQHENSLKKVKGSRQRTLSVIEEEEIEGLGGVGIEDNLSDDSDQSDILPDLNSDE